MLSWLALAASLLAAAADPLLHSLEAPFEPCAALLEAYKDALGTMVDCALRHAAPPSLCLNCGLAYQR